MMNEPPVVPQSDNDASYIRTFHFNESISHDNLMNEMGKLTVGKEIRIWFENQFPGKTTCRQ